MSPTRIRGMLPSFMVIAALLAPLPALSQRISVDIVPNFIGAGVGVTTEWLGSKDNVAGVAPMGRVQLKGARFLELYGPIADMNVIDSPNWEFGPMIAYRFGRKDVDDPVVNLLPSIKGGLEVGGFGGYHYINTQGIPWRLRLGVAAVTGVSGDAVGTNVTPYASFWFPLSPTVFAGVGTGFTWASGGFMQKRFGVDAAASAASGLPSYTAGSGIRQFYAWPAIVVRLTPDWLAGGGAFYQRLTGDASDSPIVTQRGDRNQWTVGAGVAYSWR